MNAPTLNPFIVNHLGFDAAYDEIIDRATNERFQATEPSQEPHQEDYLLLSEEAEYGKEKEE